MWQQRKKEKIGNVITLLELLFKWINSSIVISNLCQSWCYVLCQFFYLWCFVHSMVLISGGRPEGSKLNLNFQGVTWHHLRHLQSKDFFQSIIICKLDRNRYHVIATAVAAAEDLVLGFSFSWCHKLYKPLLNGCVTTYMYPTHVPYPTPATIASSSSSSSSSKEKYGLYLYHEVWKKINYKLHLVKLLGVLVLFFLGNGGSYKQVSPLISIST